MTGFEESINLVYLDGKSECKSEVESKLYKSKLDTACKFLELGVDGEIVQKATDLDLEEIKKLKLHVNFKHFFLTFFN